MNSHTFEHKPKENLNPLSEHLIGFKLCVKWRLEFAVQHSQPTIFLEVKSIEKIQKQTAVSGSLNDREKHCLAICE